MEKYSIIVHGGAWKIPDEIVEDNKKACSLAIEAGWEVLERGGLAVDAVEAAVRVLEDAPSTGAGHGASLNKDGKIELDAGIMDGKTLKAGAVGAIQRIANPISVARKVMEETDHILLVGDGALKFARYFKFAECKPAQLITESEYNAWKQGGNPIENSFVKSAMDTVGCVAYDKGGNIAVGNSTGGVRNKLPGRIGDSPLIGCGIYADNRVGGVACTGWGEKIIRVALAKTTIQLMRQYPLSEAVQRAILILKNNVKGLGGLIAIDTTGKVSYDFNTPRMAFGYRSSDMKTPIVGIEAGDKLAYQNKYRNAVGAIILNADDKVLICQRRDDPDHWQFPQGGIDDREEPLDAFYRELREEIGTDNVKPILRLPERTSYIWLPEKRAKETCYDGQSHIWILCRFLGDESDLKHTEEFTAFRWIDFDELLDVTSEMRRNTYSKILEMLSEIRKEIR
jgi:beta-aspartyl-peptidase (threonine type)